MPQLSFATSNTATVEVQFSNSALYPSQPATLTLKLPPGTSYLSDSLGISPTVSANQVQWPLPVLDPFEHDAVHVQLIAPNTTLGTRYSLTASLTISGSDNIATNNTSTSTLMIAQQTYLPDVMQYVLQY